MNNINYIVINGNDYIYYDINGCKMTGKYNIEDLINIVQNIIYCYDTEIDKNINYKNKLFNVFKEYYDKNGELFDNIEEIYLKIDPENNNGGDISKEDKIMECYKYITTNIEGNIPVTELLRYLPEKVLIFSSKYFKYEKIDEKKKIIELKMESKQEEFTEQVSDINGIAIPMYHKYKIQNKINEINELLCFYDKNDEFNMNIFNKLTEIKKKKLNISDILFISNLWSSYISGYIFKINQINNYNWIDEVQIEELHNRMMELKLNEKSIFEKNYNIKKDWDTMGKGLTGYIDCNDGENIWEFKYVKSISLEHLIQLAIYKYIIEENEKDKKYNYILYNVYNGEKYKITGTHKNLSEMVRYIFYSKYKKKKNISDIEFITNMRKIRDEYIK